MMQSIESNLDKYLEEKNLTCGICSAVYNGKEYKPMVLSCIMHSICLECITGNSKNLTSCPFCRKAIVINQDSLVPDIRTIERVQEAVEKFHKKSQKAKEVKDHNPQLTPIEKSRTPIDVPEKFEIVSFAEDCFNFVDVGVEMQRIATRVLSSMGWDGDQAVANDFYSVFKPQSSDWILFREKATGKAIGFAQFILAKDAYNKTKYEAHWIGSIEKDPNIHYEFFKQMVNLVASRRIQPCSNDWEEYSLKSIFNYDNPYEETVRKKIVVQLEALDIRVSTTEKIRRFSQQFCLHQRTVEVFPVEKPGHPQKELKNSESYEICARSDLQTSINPKVSLCLDPHGFHLRNFFFSTVQNTVNTDRDTILLVDEFKKNPQNYFIYVVNGQARGYVQLERNDGRFVVKNCKLAIQQKNYAEHFIQEFKKWATTTPCFSKGQSAKGVSFDEHFMSFNVIIQNAILRIS